MAPETETGFSTVFSSMPLLVLAAAFSALIPATRENEGTFFSSAAPAWLP